PSAIPADRRLDSAAGFATFPTARPLPRSGGRQSHPASEAAGYIPGTPSRCQTTRRTPETSEDNQSQRRDALAAFPSLNAIRGTDVCEGDTHCLDLVRSPAALIYCKFFTAAQTFTLVCSHGRPPQIVSLRGIGHLDC